ncbi:hypothetical protein BFP76_12135 [Amylibacter kogurei]|uniref:histidine kinase n=1 Tax=Paramylibacter kogurei TaxID=1889778 RepID=A0A2G5KDD9_9RHOB|nr:ATP-binding protein [Amylibacter kogurei]PIB26634.1 hypothetical protein BFP76_12135 [Amylibacter kogurei]
MASNRPRLSRIGLATAQSILLPLIIASVVSCTVLVNWVYRTEQNRLMDELDHHGRTLVTALEQSLWLFDDPLTKQHIDDAIEFNFITFAKIEDNFGENYQTGTLQPTNMFTREYTIERNFRGRQIELGTLQLGVDTRHLIRDSILLAVFEVVIFFATIMIASLVIYLHLKNNLLSHLNAIAQKLKSSPEFPLGFNIALNRKNSKPDELDELVESIHHMHHQLITTRATSEQTEGRFQGASKFAALAHCTVDLHTFRLIEADEAFIELIELDPETMHSIDLINELAPSRLTEPYLSDVPEILARLLRFESVENVMELSLPSGKRKVIRHLFVPLPTEPDGTRLVNMIAQDITEIYEMQNSLLQSQKVQAIGKLTGGVAHDVNNILAIISGNIELSQILNSNEKIDEYLSVALTATQRGAGLTRQLLAFARQQPLLPKAINPSELIQESKELIRTTIGEHISITAETNDDIWRCTADEAQLQAVILNLVSNARDAMPYGGKLSIAVSNVTLDEEFTKTDTDLIPGDFVCICVSDNGMGMNEEILNKVIDPFFTTKPLGSGTGLGLSMAFGFAKQSNGHLQINSKIGKGTCVRLYLPRDFSVDIKQLDTFKNIPHDFLVDKCILLIEDDNVLREIYAKQLSNTGCMVRSASDGPTAVTLASSMPHIDLVLSDFILPNGMNGNVACQEILKLHPNAKTLLMSGYTGDADLSSPITGAVGNVLQKPFEFADLLNAIFATLSTQTSIKVAKKELQQ